MTKNQIIVLIIDLLLGFANFDISNEKSNVSGFIYENDTGGNNLVVYDYTDYFNSNIDSPQEPYLKPIRPKYHSVHPGIETSC